MKPSPPPSAFASDRRARPLKRRAQLLGDLGVLGVAFWLAYLLRFDFELPPEGPTYFWTQLPYVVLLQLAALVLADVPSFFWRYVGLREAKVVARALLAAMGLILGLRLALPKEWAIWRVPLSIALVDTLLAVVGILGIRILRRLAWEERAVAADATETAPRRLLLLGAGSTGIAAARELARQAGAATLVGFVDDDPEKTNTLIEGIRVLGASPDLPRLVRQLAIDRVVVTIRRGSRQAMRRIVDLCESIPVEVRIVPGLLEALEGEWRADRLREIQLEDLLGRDPVILDPAAIRAQLAGRCVAVTGAGGTIGSELARQIAAFSPRRLLLIDQAELGLFDLGRELEARHPGLDFRAVVADVADTAGMKTMLEAERPSILLHSAAHKHVPLMEANPREAVRNNLLATWRLAEAAASAGAECFVFISTDKAVRPTSVMGATKALAEQVISSCAARHSTRFVSVRFGNVIGSTGSVVPIFREQIARGGPVTVTHPDMVRYFMTPAEAARLVLEAAAIGQGGEVFVLDMGEPVKIVDLAADLIRLAGRKVGEDVEIVFTGVRPGEKLVEELGIDPEKVSRTIHPKIFVARADGAAPADWDVELARLERMVKSGSEPELRRALEQLIPGARLG